MINVEQISVPCMFVIGCSAVYICTKETDGNKSQIGL